MAPKAPAKNGVLQTKFNRAVDTNNDFDSPIHSRLLQSLDAAVTAFAAYGVMGIEASCSHRHYREIKANGSGPPGVAEIADKG